MDITDIIRSCLYPLVPIHFPTHTGLTPPHSGKGPRKCKQTRQANAQNNAESIDRVKRMGGTRRQTRNISAPESRTRLGGEEQE